MIETIGKGLMLLSLTQNAFELLMIEKWQIDLEFDSKAELHELLVTR